MPSPHDPDHQGSTGLALGDEGAETGSVIRTKEEGTIQASRRPPSFWLGLAALVVGLATLAIVFFFFSSWSDVLAAESVGAGLALLAAFFLLVMGAWREQAHSAVNDPPVGVHDSPGEPASAATLEPPEVIAADPAGFIVADTLVEAPSEPASASTPEPPAAPATAPEAEEPPVTDAASLHGADAAPELAAPPKATRPKTLQPTHNGHSGELPAVRLTSPASDDAPVVKPALTGLPQSYPRPSGGYTLNTEAEDLSQLLGDVAEQTVIVMATKGQRGVERRERMAAKIDAFSQDMSVDPDYAPVVAFLESISALLRAGKTIQPIRELIDPFDGLYGYVLTLIRRKTGMTHD
jgi:hypothetical protein